MGAWTINNSSAESLDVTGISFRFVNQDADVATLTLARDVDGSVPEFAYWASVDIKLDGVKVFRGNVVSVNRAGNGSDESLRVSVYGAYYFFQTLTYYQVNTYTNGSLNTARAIIGGTTLQAQVTSIVDAMATLGHVTRGTISLPTITIPQEEIRNLLYSQVLEKLLRYAPGSFVSFDYSTTPPTCHVCGPSAAAVQSVGYTVGGSDQLSLTSEKTVDATPPNVILQYERSYEQITVTYTWVTQPTSPVEKTDRLYEYVGSDTYPSGSGFQVGTLTKLTLLNGSRRRRKLRFYQTNYTGTYRSLAYYHTDSGSSAQPRHGKMYELAPVQKSWFTGTYQAQSWTVTFRPLTKVTNTIPSESIIYAIPEAMLPPKDFWRSDSFEDGFEIWEVSHDITFQQTVGGSEAYRPTIKQYFINAYSRFGTLRNNSYIEREINDDDTVLEAMPPAGVAQSLWTSILASRGSGSLTITRDEPFFPSWAQRRITIGGAGVNSMVQTVTVNAFAGSTVIQFGPPTHLAPSDLIDLMRLQT